MKTIQEVTQNGIEELARFRQEFALEIARISIRYGERYPTSRAANLEAAQSHISRYWEIKSEK